MAVLFQFSADGAIVFDGVGAVGRFWFYEGETLAFRTLHAYLPRSGLIFAMALNSQPTVDHIGDLAVSVYDTLVKQGAVRATAPGTR